MLDRPPNSPRASEKPSCNSPRRVRKRSNSCDCYSEKQVDRASGKAFALPGYGGLQRSRRTAVQDNLRLKNAAEKPIIIFFGPENSHYINIRPPHTAHFLSTHRSVRLHNSLTCMGNRTDFCIDLIAFMGDQTDTLQWGQISCSLLYLLRSIGPLEQFGTRSRSSYERACWIGDFRFVFVFCFCFPMFVYQVKRVPHIPLYRTYHYT